MFYVLNVIFPVPDMDQIDDIDVYGTFSPKEARRAGVIPLDEAASIVGKDDAEHDENTSKRVFGQRKSEPVV